MTDPASQSTSRSRKAAIPPRIHQIMIRYCSAGAAGPRRGRRAEVWDSKFRERFASMAAQAPGA